MISIKTFVFNPFQVNSFLVYDETGECIIIDAACSDEEEYNEFFDFISANSLKPMALLNTHGHVDHLTGTTRVRERYSVPFKMHIDDKFLVDRAVESGQMFGISIDPPGQPDGWINDGERIEFGNSGVQAFHAPGHSPGSLLFYFAEAGLLITGDVLFAGSIGRTDLPGGDFEQLIESINAKILVLPGNTRVFPGHGRDTSIEYEMKHNPFLNRSF